MNEEKNSFEAALKSLEEAVERLESGELPLEESLRWYETGVKSAAHCQKLLKDTERRVELLLKDTEGNFREEDFSTDEE